MEEGPYSARRASVDDLPALRDLWTAGGLPADQLEPFLAEFQVAQLPHGGVAAAVGLLVEGDSGLLHSEAVVEGEDPDAARAALWRRVRIIARNQGVRELWTREDAPYWDTCGFVPVTAGARPSFAGDPDGWRSVVLGDPQQARQVVQEQMAIWQTTRAQESERLQARIRWVRTAALSLVGLLAVGCLGIMIYLIVAHPELLRRLTGGGGK